MIEETEHPHKEVLFVLEKLYPDGWSWYCGYDTLEEAEYRAKIVEERDERKVRIVKYIEEKKK